MAFAEIKRNELITYLSRQLDNLFPDGNTDTSSIIEKNIDRALDRLVYCMNHVTYWKDIGYHPLQADTNTAFLYYLANTIWENNKNKNLCEKLFYLNKSLHGFHCMYYAQLPEIFFVGHSLGVVLASITYPNYLAMHQNVTIGKNHGIAPRLEEGIVLYPGSAIIGNCHIRSNSYISINTAVINCDTPGNCTVFSSDGKIACKQATRNLLREFFITDSERKADA